jgi:hypothetical protein
MLLTAAGQPDNQSYRHHHYHDQDSYQQRSLLQHLA